MPTVSLNGAEVYYEDRGSGPSVLFIHGMCGNANVWDGQVDRLADRFRCATYDRRGHSRSSLGEIEQRTVEMHGDDAAALIRALGLMPCVLVGSSGGARVALDIVLRYPELLRGAVLSEPPLFMLDSSGAAQFQAEVRPKLQQAMAAGGPRAAVDAFFDHVCPGLWRAIDDERRDVYRANAGELMPDLQMPTHQVGRNEPSKRNEMFRLLGGGVIGDLGQMPPAQLAILPGTSHVGVLDRVDWLSSMILTFMPPTPRR